MFKLISDVSEKDESQTHIQQPKGTTVKSKRKRYQDKKV